ncbi:MAG TPA: serine/threonine-protein kinase [Polyangia bacterium]|nr:serine/threonine-protein kinase [Polyangia bacterium]
MSTEAAPVGPVTFGRYTLLERLAVGGMAEVFRAKITSSHGFEKILVIKRILPHLAADPGFVSMFIDEAKLTAQLTHPKIVQILDFGEVNGQYFTALEFIDGFDALGLLRIAAQKRTRIPTQLAVFIVQEILEALDYAHNARDMEGKPMQIVHRDISPSNIFISKRGDVKLGDFGIAHAKRRESKTQVGTLKGKYGYMSPEQVVGRPIDARSDLFAVGVVLAELLTGRRLFSAPADLDVLLKVRDVHLDRLDKYGTDIPPALDRIVRRALRKDPAERPQTAAELREELADYLFSAGQRVGSPDLRAWSGTLLGTDPEKAARMLQEVRAPDKGRPPAAERDPREQTGDGMAGSPTAAPTAAAPEGVPTVLTTPRLPEGAAAAAEDPWPDRDEHSSARRFTPISRPGENRSTARTGVRPGQTKSDVGRFVSAAPKRPPDSAGEISVITPMRFFCDMALASETGLLLFELDGTQKEIFLVGGAPESVSSSDAGERFGEYLVGRGILGPADLELALSMLPHYNGKLGDTLVALGMLRPLDVFRLLSEQVRDRVIDVFGWTEGTFAYYRGVTNRQESFPLGLDTFEILGAGVVSLPAALLERRFESQGDLRPIATGRGRVDPEAFKIGPTPREVLDMLDGERTTRAWLAQFTDRDERLTFLRSLYLLVETDLAELD